MINNEKLKPFLKRNVPSSMPKIFMNSSSLSVITEHMASTYVSESFAIKAKLIIKPTLRNKKQRMRRMNECWNIFIDYIGGDRTQSK